jgi:hypothetical protein
VETAPWRAGHPLCERYEQLRSQVLQGSVLPGQGYGFGVLLRQGMQAWMKVGQPHDGTVETAPLGGAARSRGSGILASAVQKELTLLMAAMVLNNSHREGEPTWRPILR